MNLLQQFEAVFPQQNTQTAKIVRALNNGYEAQTLFGSHTVLLRGTGYDVAQNVFYNAKTGNIIAPAPNVDVIEIDV